jgi:hypothetical protein
VCFVRHTVTEELVSLCVSIRPLHSVFTSAMRFELMGSGGVLLSTALIHPVTSFPFRIFTVAKAVLTALPASVSLDGV